MSSFNRSLLVGVLVGGLAIVKQLVEARGGAVGVRSVVGAGTTFSFTLPMERV